MSWWYVLGHIFCPTFMNGNLLIFLVPSVFSVQNNHRWSSKSQQLYKRVHRPATLASQAEPIQVCQHFLEKPKWLHLYFLMPGSPGRWRKCIWPIWSSVICQDKYIATTISWESQFNWLNTMIHFVFLWCILSQISKYCYFIEYCYTPTHHRHCITCSMVIFLME